MVLNKAARPVRNLAFSVSTVAAATSALLLFRSAAQGPLPSPTHRRTRPTIAPSPQRRVVPVPPALTRKADPSPQIVFLRKGWLFAMPITPSGKQAGPIRRIRPIRVREANSLTLSPDGRWAAVETSLLNDTGETFIEELRPHGASFCFSAFSGPAFSPDGRTVAYTGETDISSPLYLRDLRTGRETVLRNNASEPCWMGNGRSLAAVDEDDQSYLVLAMPSGRVLDRFSPGVSPLTPVVSPDGRYIGICHKISRPQVGSDIFDRRTRQLATIGCEIEGYNPALIQRWSPDGRRILWDLTVPDPDNDGSDQGDTVAYSCLDGSAQRLFGRGGQGHFSPDSLHVLWIDRWAWNKPHPGRLLYCSLEVKPQAILGHIDAFDVLF